MRTPPETTKLPASPTQLSRREFLTAAIATATAAVTSNVLAACEQAPQGDGIPDYLMEEKLVRAYPRVFDILIQQKRDSYREDLYNVVDLMEKTIEFFDKYTAGEPVELAEYEPLMGADSQTGHVMGAEAQERYAAKVAHLLYVDDSELVPWSIETLSYEGLEAILDFNEMFMRSVEGEYISMASRYYPSAPDRVYDFLLDKDLIKETPEATVYALTDWARLKFQHVTGDTPEQPGNKKLHADRWGTPELMEMLEQVNDGGRLIIDGCHGTASLYWQLLGALGIPAKRTRAMRGHSGISFPTVGEFTIHADHIYDKKFSTSGRNLPSSKMLPRIPANIDLDSEENGEDLEYLEESHYLRAEAAMPFPSDDFAAWYGLLRYNPIKREMEEAVIEENRRTGEGPQMTLHERIYAHLPVKAEELIVKINARLEEVGGGNKLDGAAIIYNDYLIR